MIQKIIWTKLLLFGAIGSLWSCGKPTDRFVADFEDDVYQNTTEMPIVIEGYGKKRDITGENFKEEWIIFAGGSIKFNFDFGAGMNGNPVIAPRFCDSVKIVFDHSKVLWYRCGDKQAGNILNQRNATKSYPIKDHTQFLFVIDSRLYDLATEIVE